MAAAVTAPVPWLLRAPPPPGLMMVRPRGLQSELE